MKNQFVNTGVLPFNRLFLLVIMTVFLTTTACRKAEQVHEVTESGIQYQKNIASTSAITYTFQNLFIGGQNGYHSYRIPSIVKTKAGTLIAICEGRELTNRDYGNINVICKRLVNGSSTWGEPSDNCRADIRYLGKSNGCC